MNEPGLEFVFEATGGVSPPQVIGAVPTGRRQVIPIDAGGPFVGPDIKGTMVSGFDWQLIRADGVTEVDAMYLLETGDGVRIECRNRGVRHGPASVMQRMMQGQEVDPAEYYFRTTPVFTAPEGRYDWLNRSVFVCTGARYRDGVKVRFYRVT
ncbi:DUF3237 domain-containing protein [Pararhodobacter zhoushanensis]|uniref:UPF0311 protein OKW52_03845 n=1 Tax=Pararhodobacter zhoushanensis TaxID=2479545 RepID=A0ABT3GV55_9RHOB|nr:DUF3237 domain-containing protein [Pararhodobacter zhoushanensis]MCW1931417.1 DUF3237 domain-containing protein [Pararhodobacter zhoushanensis]